MISDPATARGGSAHPVAVAAPKQEAVDAGERVLRAGGNAVDAAIAASFALFVVEPFMTGPGAVGELVYLDPSGIAHVVDAAARAPAQARDDMYAIVGERGGLYAWPTVEEEAHTLGPRAVTAPSLVPGLYEAHERFGRAPWADLVLPAIELASRGWEIDYFTSAVLTHEMPTLARDPLAAELYYPLGFPLPPPIGGPPQRVRNEPLAATLAAIAERGPTALSSGAVAESMLTAAGPPRGILTDADLAGANARVISEVAPLVRFRGWSIYGSPFASGAVTVAEILALVELVGGAHADPASPERYVRVALASDVAFTDRLSKLTGDDALEAVHALLSETSLSRAWAVRERGSAAGGTPGLPRQAPVTATTHVTAIDSEGAVVALTHTLLSLFGAKVGVTRGGFFLNNGMMWFDPRPGHPNSIRPGLRALTAMSPVVAVSPDGKRKVAVGALGARRIITAVAQVLENVIDYEMEIEEAVNWPRVHSDTIETRVDERLPTAVFAELTAAGLAPEPGHSGPTSLAFARAYGATTDETGTCQVGIDRRAQRL